MHTVHALFKLEIMLGHTKHTKWTTMLGFTYRLEREEWTKARYVNGVITYVNPVHAGIHSFLSQCCDCEYKYFINQKCWGFSITRNISRRSSPHPHRWAYLLVRDSEVGLALDRAMSPEDAPTKLEVADPVFFNKVGAFLRAHDLVRTDEKTE